jgi:GntR family transcriptional regulator
MEDREVVQMSEAETRAIDRASPIPFYYQLQEILKEEIERGTWRPGDLLPSEGDLERSFGVSRTVIRQALDVLQADGQISRGRGKKSMVAEPKFRWEATIGAREWSQPGSRSQVTLGQLVDARRVPAGGHVGRLLGVGSAVHVFELTFTQEVDGRPVALSQMYLRRQATVKLEEMCAAEDQLPVLVERGPDVPDQLAERYGIAVAVSDVTVELTQMNEFEAALLGAALGSPAFLVSALDLDGVETPLSFTRTVIRGERFRFSLALRHPDAQGVKRSPGFVAYMT